MQSIQKQIAAGELIAVEYPLDMEAEEMEVLVADEVACWKLANGNKEIASIQLIHVGNGELDVKTTEKSKIKRLRRITGYLSDMVNFNDAKKEELAQRHVHMPNRCGCD